MNTTSRRDLMHDLLLPTVFLAALGGMTWAVRGCSGFGAMKGCIFAGVTLGAGWWFLAHDPSGKQSRRYASAWIILALTVGIGYSGSRGWMQWSSFWNGVLQTNSPAGEFVPISRSYGYLWLFIAGVPWAGLGACVLAWTGSQRPTRAWEWALRLASGFGMAYFLGSFLFTRYPEIFLPLYSSIKEQYQDTAANPNLQRLINDNRAAITHLGLYLGFLLFEVVRRDWKNVTLILTVGILNGAGWALLQNWSWAKSVWPTANFNFWRCWETSGGISIGIAYGIAYFLANRPMSDAQKTDEAARLAGKRPNLEWLLAAGLLVLLGVCMMAPPVEGVGARRAFARATAPSDGYLYLVVGIVYAIGCTAYYFATRTMLEAIRARRKTLLDAIEWVGGFGLLLVFAWYFKSRFGIRGGRFGGRSDSWINSYLGNWGNDFFYVAVAYGVVAVIGFFAIRKMSGQKWRLQPDLDWLATYLGLLVVGSALIMGETRSAWNYHIWFAVVGAIFGIVYYVLTRSPSEEEKALQGVQAANGDPNLERWGLAVGLLIGLGVSLKNGLRGWANIYIGNEEYWTPVFWNYIGAAVLVCLVVLGIAHLFRHRPREFQGDVFPHATAIIWIVLIQQNIIAQLITGPVTNWNWQEQIFSFYYLFLFIVTGFIVYHYNSMRKPCGYSQESA